VYSKIGAADLVVFYCSVAEERSPTMMALYQDAVLVPEKRPPGYNEGQVVRLLAGGIRAYKELTNEVVDGVPVNDDVPFRTLRVPTSGLTLCVGDTNYIILQSPHTKHLSKIMEERQM
jgi:hypothetical protein